MIVVELVQIRRVVIVGEHLHSMVRNWRQVGLLHLKASGLRHPSGMRAVLTLLVNVNLVRQTIRVDTVIEGCILLTKLSLTLLG